jgi:hypothetical protein
VTNSVYAKKMQFVGKFGHCCGKPFHKKSFLEKHPQYKIWENVLKDMPAYNWTMITKN